MSGNLFQNFGDGSNHRTDPAQRTVVADAEGRVVLDLGDRAKTIVVDESTDRIVILNKLIDLGKPAFKNATEAEQIAAGFGIHTAASFGEQRSSERRQIDVADETGALSDEMLKLIGIAAQGGAVGGAEDINLRLGASGHDTDAFFEIIVDGRWSSDVIRLEGALAAEAIALTAPEPQLTNITHGGNNISTRPAISADGGMVVFTSRASNLIDGQLDQNGGTPDIFHYDVASGDTMNITDGGTNSSIEPTISADGGTVAFSSYASNLVDGQRDQNGETADIFLYDVASGDKVNVTDGGNGFSNGPAISADGGTVVFHSNASNLIDGQPDQNGGTPDIFLYDVASGDTINITDGGNNSSFEAAISADGGTVVFFSYASNLINGQPDQNASTVDIFLYDVASGETVSITNGGNSWSSDPAISSDGGTVVFTSRASNLIVGQTDQNGMTADIFLHDVASGATVNLTDGANGDSFRPMISDDGGAVTFFSRATNLVDGQPDQNANVYDVFVYDVASGDTVNITDGGDALSLDPVISADGSIVAFASNASNLVPGQTDLNGGLTDIFLFDLV